MVGAHQSRSARALLAVLLLTSSPPPSIAEDVNGGEYLIGTGIYDMTGPAAQINMMGYAKRDQTAHGIHIRLRSRAFIISENSAHGDGREEDGASGSVEEQDRRRLSWSFLRRKEQTVRNSAFSTHADPEKTVCFVSMDAGMGSDLLTARVLARLEELLPVQGSTGKRLCHRENLSISGTHTHSAPGGFLQYVLYQITSYGFSEQTMGAYVEGVAQSIVRAVSNLQPGSITAASGLLHNTNINRSPTSYLLNPKDERDMYADEGDTDKNMLLLKFTRDDGRNVGALNWFSVHGTSMNNTNTLISGDNKGYASYLMEKQLNGEDTLPGKGDFVAAFASTNLGDVSPNTNGPRCIDTGLPCDVVSSTCNGRNELCIASGPGKDMFESTEIIGRRQYEHALSLLQGNSTTISGEVSFRHSFVDMSNREVRLENGGFGRTCPAALGYSFAAGTSDGPGDFDFTQATNTSNAFWNMIGGFVSVPSKEQADCHNPKPIFLNTGPVNKPYKWDPAVVPISVFRVGQLFIVSVPCEFTTMAGRRLRRAIAKLAVEHGIQNPIVTIAGLANSYTHYVTTLEEYAGQRYEAASTLYGPHTHAAYVQEYERITSDLLNNKVSASDKAPQDLSKHQMSLLPPVEMDTVGIGKKFGSVSVNAHDSYMAGVDTVEVKFRSANPRNNLRIEDTFLTVDMLNEDGSWTTKYVDGDWCTRFIWKEGAGGKYLGVSFAHIMWEIPAETPEGRYRICHQGTRKGIIGETVAAVLQGPGVSNTVTPALGIMSQLVSFAGSYSERVSRGWGSIFPSRYKDFSGCSKTFSVNAQ